MSMITQSDAEKLIHGEALCLDTCAWDAWLDLFTDDVIYWVPAWKDESSLTSSPETELSLIYYSGRKGLADRISRLTGGLSPASVPLRRTSHLVSNILLGEANDTGESSATAAFAVFQFDPKRRTQHVFFGRYEYQFRSVAGNWRIAKKKTILANDQIPAVADLYLL